MAMNNDKSVKEKKPRKKLSVVFKQFWSDLKKITWPTVGQTTKNFGVVLLVILIAGVLIFALDQGLFWGLGKIMSVGTA